MKKSMLLATILVFALPAASGNWGLTEVQAAQGPQSCWGQATKVFAQMGEMGEHAREQGNPRLGLRNLARALFEAGILADDSMQALGAFVADELGLSIEACL